MSYYDITCPKCFVKHDADELEKNTEYGCWSSDEVNVECPDCGFDFEVQCEHAGYQATDSFDIKSFRRAHKIVYPEGSNRIFVDHYLSHLVEKGKTNMVEDAEDRYKHNDQWKAAYYVALSIWKDIQEARGEGKDEQDEEG